MSQAHSHLASGPLDMRFLRHAEAPGNQVRPAGATGEATETGQCGDSVDVVLRVQDERIAEIGVVPHGCLYTVVCASALGKLAQGLEIDQALNLGPEDVEKELGGLPEDHLHCARLVINTLGEAIADHYHRAGTGAPAAAPGS